MAELKRRKVFRVAAVYGGAAFVVLQVADILAEGLQLPPGFLGAISVLAIAAFPIVLFLAWVFERTPQGLRRTAPAAEGEIADIVDQPVGRRWPAGILALAGTLLLLVGGWTVLQSAGEPAATGSEPVVEAAGPERTRIAVLPFSNLSGDDETATIALGIHNDIYTRLTRLSGLQVTARPSVMKYADTTEDLADVARALNVGSILTGSVQRSGDVLRIVVELIDPAAARSLWANTYDRERSVDGLLALQAEVAERSAEELQATLSQAEREAIQTTLTRDPQAYAYYVEALDAFDLGFEEEYSRLSIRMAGLAVEADPEFAAAWAHLAHSHLSMYWDAADRTPERLVMARSALDEALRLDPDLPDVRVVVGIMHYWGNLAYDEALAVLNPLEREAPSTRYLIDTIGAVKRRQGKMEEAARYFLRAGELDPAAPWLGEAGLTYYLMRRYEQAQPLMETDLERNPFSGFGYGENARLHLAWKGDVETARRIVADGYAVRAQNPMLEWTAVHTEILGREYDRALALIDESREPALGELQFFYYPPDLLRGRVLAFVGDDDGSRAAYESAARVLESERQALPDDERIAGALGLAYAGLGLRDEALAEARRAVDLMPLEREFWRGTHRQEELARVYARLGETEDAIDMLETLLSQPGELSAALLRLDPEWDSLRDDPRFQALVEE